MKVNNYVKLSVRASLSLHDDESLHAAPSAERAAHVVSWVFPFGATGDKAALKLAQDKRATLRTLFPELSGEAFQLSTFARSALRGVPVVGEPLRVLALVEAA